jgi:WD40 repeat protein
MKSNGQRSRPGSPEFHDVHKLLLRSQIDRKTYDARPPYHSLAFSPDGNRLAASNPNGSVYVWNTKDLSPALEARLETPPQILSGSAHPLGPVAFQPGGELILAGNEGGELLFWQASDHHPRLMVRRIERTPIREIAFLSDGTFVTGSESGELAVWNERNGPAYSRGGRLWKGG